MLSNSVLSLVRNTIYSNLALFFIAFLLQLILSDGSPVSDATRSLNSGCPAHWMRMGRFCYKEGKGSTHREVASYCYGYDGIGINGLCLIKADEKIIDGLGCPEGWKHYQNICVYKTVSAEEQCHHLKAEEFYGFCLKHAEPKEQEIQEKDNFSSTDKRVCCCPHFHAKANGYAC